MSESQQSKTLAKLESAIRRHNFLYWIQNAPEVSDYEFDRLVEELRQRAPDSPVLHEIGAGAAETDSLGRPVIHERAMLSLDKCYEEADLRRWSESFEGPVVQSPKVDGVAASFRYDENGKLALAATRGDGRQGEEFTSNALLIPSVPYDIGQGPLEIRGEVYMPLSLFEKYAAEASNPRNLTAGTLKRKQSDRSQLLDLRFFAYDLDGADFDTESHKMAHLAELGFQSVEYERLERDAMQAGYERWLARRSELDFEVDGVVYKAERVSEHKKLGHTAHHPRFSIAYKFQGESGQSVLRKVEWSVARTGAITPVAIIDPVRLSGAEVERCSLHNLNILRRHGLHLGDTVVAVRRGGVIPHVETTLGGGEVPVEIPNRCPSCGKATKTERDFLLCGQPEECPAVQVGILEHFVKQTGIDGFGTKLLARLFELGWVRDPADLYTLTARQLVQLDRMGDTLARKLVTQIEAARELPFDVFLRALGIPELGRQVSSQLAAHYETFEKLRESSMDELKELPGVGPEIARNVVHGLQDLEPLLGRLLEHIEIAAPAKTSTEGALAGQSVVFTGKMVSLDRKSAQQRAREAGATTPSGVKKDLSLLVIGDEGSPLLGPGRKSSKHTKAERYNEEGASIEIITESEFLRRLET